MGTEAVTVTALAATLLVGLVAGWTAGRRYERAARGWADYHAHKAALPLLKAAAIALTRRAVLTVLLGAALAAFAVYALATRH
ncbi:MAG: hypothetical protein ACRDTU_16575 [Micromonosporaceae bacterium]